MNDFKVEQKWVVFNNKDINRYLDENEQRSLSHFYQKVYNGRMKEGKPINSYIVCNEDEPYSNEIWEVLKNGEAKKHKTDFIGNSR